MQVFFLFSFLISLMAVFSYLNEKFIRLPSRIGLMLMGTFVSLILLVSSEFEHSFTDQIRSQLSLIDFGQLMLNILLSFLLFAGALQVDFNKLRSTARSVLVFSIIGTLISTGLVGAITYYLFALFHISVSFTEALLFGALISPTDPIAVIGILKKAGISPRIQVTIEGESLFNDGIGVVLFMTIQQTIGEGVENISVFSVLGLFAQEALGGIAAGLVIWYAGFFLIKTTSHFQTQIMITLAMVMGGSVLCTYLHVSAPLAMVVVGLLTGNLVNQRTTSGTIQDYTLKFWEMIDEILNALLFLLIGLELMLVHFNLILILIGLLTSVLLIPARFISLWIPTHVFRIRNQLEDHSLKIMTWGGLRGGIAIALALSFNSDALRNVVVPITFIIVLFSVLVQGFTMEKVVARLNRR